MTGSISPIGQNTESVTELLSNIGGSVYANPLG